MSDIKEMLDQAKAVMQNAYAPYSKFKVGAVARGANGKLYQGCNVENAAYPLGTCAEAGAIAAMVADGETQLAEIVVMGSVGKKSVNLGAWRHLSISATLSKESEKPSPLRNCCPFLLDRRIYHDIPC